MLEVTPKTPEQCSTPLQLNATLYLNIFQGEPAISGFDWHITSNHNSSEHLAAYTGAGFHLVIHEASPWSWLAHPVSGRSAATYGRPIQARFHYGYGMQYLNLATAEHSPAHSSIGTRSLILRKTLSDY